MMKKNLLISIFSASFIFASLCNAQQPVAMLPRSDLQKFNHEVLAGLWDSITNNPAVVVWYQSREQLTGHAKRQNNFRRDYQVSDDFFPLVSYIGSGFDRGHLCPSADMLLDSQSNAATFYMSNICPQVPAFNRGSWKRLESLTRLWALKDSGQWCYSGPVYLKPLGTIGAGEIKIPSHFFKIVFKPGVGAVGFIMENSQRNQTAGLCMVPIDSIEVLTNFDFLNFLPDSIESLYESGSFNNVFLKIP